MFDRKKRNIVGIALENDHLTVATIQATKGKVRVVRLQKTKLVESLDKSVNTKNDPVPTEEPEGSIFDLDKEFGAKPAASPSMGDPLLEDYDMTADVQEESNTLQVANILNREHPKHVALSLNIPLGDTIFQVVSDLDAKKEGKKKTHQQLRDRMNALYGQVVSDDQLQYYVRDDGSIMMASIGGGMDLLDMVEASLPLYPGKVVIRDVVPDEAVLLGLVRANYMLESNQMSCIIHVQAKQSVVIFAKGREFHSILPVIQEGTQNPKFVRTIFSKILFEVDRGKVPTIDRIIVTGDTDDGKLTSYLKEQFLEVDVEPFLFSPAQIDLEDIGEEDPQDYLKAIGVACAAVDTAKTDYPPLSFVPKAVQVRQQVLKLSWHGYLLLGLIAITPLLFNFQYQAKRKVYIANERELEILNQQITETKVVADVVDRFTADFNDYSASVTLLDTLSENTLKWTKTLDLINSSTERIRSSWLQSLQSSQQNRLMIQGSTLSRDRIPMISDSFANAIILRVVEKPERVTIYDFTLMVTKIVEDDSVFHPVKPVIPSDTLQVEAADTTAMNDQP